MIFYLEKCGDFELNRRTLGFQFLVRVKPSFFTLTPIYKTRSVVNVNSHLHISLISREIIYIYSLNNSEGVSNALSLRGVISGNDVDQALPWSANLLFQTSDDLSLLYLSEQRNRRKGKEKLPN